MMDPKTIAFFIGVVMFPILAAWLSGRIRKYMEKNMKAAQAKKKFANSVESVDLPPPIEVELKKKKKYPVGPS